MFVNQSPSQGKKTLIKKTICCLVAIPQFLRKVSRVKPKMKSRFRVPKGSLWLYSAMTLESCASAPIFPLDQQHGIVWTCCIGNSLSSISSYPSHCVLERLETSTRAQLHCLLKTDKCPSEANIQSMIIYFLNFI